MREHAALDAAAALGRMFGASSERVAELARWMERQLTCEACAGEAVTLLNDRMERFPVPKRVREAYAEVNDSPRHANHYGQGVRTVEVGKLEAFWRADAVRVIQTKVSDKSLALFVAAQMWWSRVEPTEGAVAAEMEVDLWRLGAESFTRSKPVDDLVTAAFHRARKMATEGEDALTPDDLDLAVIA